MMKKQLSLSALFLVFGFFLGVIVSKAEFLDTQATQGVRLSTTMNADPSDYSEKCVGSIKVVNSTVDINDDEHTNIDISRQNDQSTDQEDAYKSILKAPKNYKGAIVNAISVMDDNRALSVIGNILRLQDDDLNSITEPKSYLKKAAGILLNEEYMDASVEEDINYVNFSLDESGYSNPDDYESYVFSPNSKKIHANFPSANYSENRVLAKWVHADSGEVLLFESYEINPNEDSNYVWVEKENWDVGHYVVEYFSPTSLERISTGQFDIW